MNRANVRYNDGKADRFACRRQFRRAFATRSGQLMLGVLSLLGMAALIPATALAQTTILRTQTGSPGTTGFVFTTALQTVLQKHLPVQLNVTSGQAATRSTLDAARGNADLFTSSPAINHYMSKGIQMYKDMKDAPKLFDDNVRGILNYPLGPYHILAYESTGIRTLEDMRGKKGFIGPPGGAATVVALGIIEGITGMKPNVDYQQAKLDWTSGAQAFQDRQVDFAIIPTELPSPQVTQFALADKLRLISLPANAGESEQMKSILSTPGRTIMEIPVGVYGANQVNTEPVRAVGSYIGLSTRTSLDEQLVYDITRAIFENIGDFHAAAPFLKVITKDTALDQMNGWLHKGALRYYREIGVKVDPALVPPEAR